FDTPYPVGGLLNGMDIAPDDSYLLLGQDRVGVTQGTVQRLDLTNRSIVNINYDRAIIGNELGSWDVSIMGNGRGFFTTRYNGSGATPFREIDLSSNVAGIRDTPAGGPFGLGAPAQLQRSADRSTLLILEGNLSSGPMFTYTSSSNTFGSVYDAQFVLNYGSFAVNRS